MEIFENGAVRAGRRIRNGKQEKRKLIRVFDFFSYS